LFRETKHAQLNGNPKPKIDRAKLHNFAVHASPKCFDCSFEFFTNEFAFFERKFKKNRALAISGTIF
jgi:hypothetical protein